MYKRSIFKFYGFPTPELFAALVKHLFRELTESSKCAQAPCRNIMDPDIPVGQIATGNTITMMMMEIEPRCFADIILWHASDPCVQRRIQPMQWNFPKGQRMTWKEQKFYTIGSGNLRLAVMLPEHNMDARRRHNGVAKLAAWVLACMDFHDPAERPKGWNARTCSGLSDTDVQQAGGWPYSGPRLVNGWTGYI